MVCTINSENRIKADTIKEAEEFAVDQPRFLNDNALQYPQTAIKALLDESKRLFEKPTFKIISHALNLHRTDIKSDVKLKKLVKESREDIAVDIDELYYQRIKAIYSRIVKYGTLIQSNFTLAPEKMEAINNIKSANRLMVEAIKNSRGLQKNVDKYMNSDNVYIRKEYDRLRKKISRVLREVYVTRKDEHPETHLELLARLKEKAKKSDVMRDGTLDKLIRKGLISSEMATSLANDSDNVAGISKNLIDVAELLYIDSDTILQDPIDIRSEGVLEEEEMG